MGKEIPEHRLWAETSQTSKGQDEWSWNKSPTPPAIPWSHDQSRFIRLKKEAIRLSQGADAWRVRVWLKIKILDKTYLHTLRADPPHRYHLIRLAISPEPFPKTPILEQIRFQRDENNTRETSISTGESKDRKEQNWIRLTERRCKASTTRGYRSREKTFEQRKSFFTLLSWPFSHLCWADHCFCRF